MVDNGWVDNGWNRTWRKGEPGSISSNRSNGLLEPPPPVKVVSFPCHLSSQVLWEGSRKLAAGLPLLFTFTEIESISPITVTAVLHIIIKHGYKAVSWKQNRQQPQEKWTHTPPIGGLSNAPELNTQLELPHQCYKRIIGREWPRATHEDRVANWNPFADYYLSQ